MKLSKVISTDIFDDGRLNIASHDKNIDVELLSWIKEQNCLIQGFQNTNALSLPRRPKPQKPNEFPSSRRLVPTIKN